jgi:hypothetical protein
MVLHGLWSRARSGRQCSPKHPRPVQVSDRRLRERVIELAGSAALRTSRSQGTDRIGDFGDMSTGHSEQQGGPGLRFLQTAAAEAGVMPGNGT